MKRGFTPLKILALVLLVSSRASADETHAPGSPDDASSARDGDDDLTGGAVAMQAELDAMERVLVATREKLRALEESIDGQTVRLQAMRALSARPGVSCDESTDAAERLASALTLGAQAARLGRQRPRHASSDGDGDANHPSSSDAVLESDDYGGLVMSSASHLYGGEHRAVARRRDAWHDHLRLIAAVKIDADVTALAVMPQRGEHELSRYFAVGDSTGAVHVFRPDGDLALVSPPPGESADVPVTHVHCMLRRRNETVVLAGHADGTFALHLIAESVDEGNGGVVRDHLQTLSVSVVSAYSMSRDAVSSAAFARPSRMRGKGRSVQERLAAGWRRQDADELDGVGHDSSPRNESGSVQTSMQSALTDPRRIVAAEMYRINNRRYIAVADAVGKIAVVDVESRKIHSVFLAPDGVVAFRQSPHYVAWVGATAAGAADLATLEIMRKPCANLNGTSIVKARFDVAASGRFVGVGVDGELLTGFVNVDQFRTMCAIRNVRKNLRLSPQVSIATIKGYAFAADPYEVTVLNTTVVGKKPPRDVTVAPLPHLSATFGRQLDTDALSHGPGLVASNRGRLVVVAFPDGLLASYESDLPVWRPAPMNTKLWSQPVFVAAMGLIGLWQFYRSRGHRAMGSSFGGSGIGKDGDGGLDPKLLEQLMGKNGGGAMGTDSSGPMGGKSTNYGDNAMRRPGYRDFDPAAFREEMKKSGKWS